MVGMDMQQKIGIECVSNKDMDAVNSMVGSLFESNPSVVLIPDIVKEHSYSFYHGALQHPHRSQSYRYSDSSVNQHINNHDTAEKFISNHLETKSKELELSFTPITENANYPMVQSKADNWEMPHVSSLQSIEPSKVAGAGGKQRIRWTQELHEKFVEAVNSLGGAMQATPKRILSLMKSQGLTIFHIKSHLQKYRTTRYAPPNLHQGRSSSKASHYNATFKGGGGVQISETLRLQMDVQRTLHEHLEFQKKLQLRIEEQANHLQRMFNQQRSRNLYENHYQNKINALDPSPNCSSSEELYAFQDQIHFGN